MKDQGRQIKELKKIVKSLHTRRSREARAAALKQENEDFDKFLAEDSSKESMSTDSEDSEWVKKDPVKHGGETAQDVNVIFATTTSNGTIINPFTAIGS